MSKLKLTLPGNEIPVDGKVVSFRAPCGCSDISCLQIDGVDYTIANYLGTSIAGKDYYWKSGALVSVTLDVTNKKAYLVGSTDIEPSFVITLTLTGDVSSNTATVSSDKTYEEIKKAHQAGKRLVVNIYAPSAEVGADDVYVFSCDVYATFGDNDMFMFITNMGRSRVDFILQFDNTWYVDSTNLISSSEYAMHTSDQNNPHKVTASQVGAVSIAEFNSAIKKWQTIGSVSYSMQSTYNEKANLTIPIDTTLLEDCSEYRYILKAGSNFNLTMHKQNYSSPVYKFYLRASEVDLVYHSGMPSSTVQWSKTFDSDEAFYSGNINKVFSPSGAASYGTIADVEVYIFLGANGMSQSAAGSGSCSFVLELQAR